jgi:hypothetical protein
MDQVFGAKARLNSGHWPTGSGILAQSGTGGVSGQGVNGIHGISTTKTTTTSGLGYGEKTPQVETFFWLLWRDIFRHTADNERAFGWPSLLLLNNPCRDVDAAVIGAHLLLGRCKIVLSHPQTVNVLATVNSYSSSSNQTARASVTSRRRSDFTGRPSHRVTARVVNSTNSSNSVSIPVDFRIRTTWFHKVSDSL